MKITDFLNGKKVLIWGYGREGKSTENFIKTCCTNVVVDVFEGDRKDIAEDQYDYIIKSPGIVMLEDNPKYTSATELFLMEFRDQTIGITGTKGKSTTTALLAHALANSQDRPVLFLGNIGKPCLDYYSEITSDSIIVFEMSCHQLAHGDTSPHIGVFLNLYEDHLDYYKTMDKYFTAKSHIGAYQKPGDILLCGENVPEFESAGDKKVFGYDSSAYSYELKLLGEHNQYNANIVHYICCEIFDCEDGRVRSAMKDFAGLPHRLQFAGEYEGIRYYDDSISTIPEACIQASESVPDVQTLLVGGMDRGIDYDILEDFILKRNDLKFICMYASGERVKNETISRNDGKAVDNIYQVEDLEAAVEMAKKITDRNKACVLSPAAASYGYFKNFEHRGDVFQELIK